MDPHAQESGSSSLGRAAPFEFTANGSQTAMVASKMRKHTEDRDEDKVFHVPTTVFNPRKRKDPQDSAVTLDWYGSSGRTLCYALRYSSVILIRQKLLFKLEQQL